MPLMPSYSEEFSLQLALAESMQVCAEGVATLGWRTLEQSMTRLKCAEVKSQIVSFTWPVQVEIILKGEPDGTTRAILNGSTFGLGSLQSNYLREQVQNLRQAIEYAFNRRTAKPQEEKSAAGDPSGATETLASELERLAKLHATGALSDQEFQQAKQRLLHQSAQEMGQAAPAQNSSARSVIINRVRLSDEQLIRLEQRFRLRVADGAYWYDQVSGAWGREGGPTLGFTQPHMELGGPLRADASGGNTGVFINGRELHQLDVAALRQLTPYVIPGRYWVDARGIGGYEGGPPIFDLRALARAAGGTQGGPWSYASPHGGAKVGGDGQGFNYFVDKDSSWSSGD